MKEAAAAILSADRGFEAEPLCVPTTEVFEIVGANRVREQDRLYSKSERISFVIPAAGKDPVFPELPKSQIAVGGKPIIDHQIETLRKAGLTNNKVFVIRGHEAEQFTRTDVEYRDNDRYLETQSLYSLFLAQEAMIDGFALIYSDILFNESVIHQLIGSGGDIVLLIDSSYRYHKHDVDKKLDLVVSSRGPTTRWRRLQPNALLDLTRVAKGVPAEEADHEFVGMAYFSERGAEILRTVYHDVAKRDPSPFHEAPSFQLAQITDIFQEMIDRDFPVQGLEVSMGWIEIHNRQDVRLAEQELLSTDAANR
jgi:phosphoenolpyruvate phosphomutase